MTRRPTLVYTARCTRCGCNLDALGVPGPLCPSCARRKPKAGLRNRKAFDRLGTWLMYGAAISLAAAVMTYAALWYSSPYAHLGFDFDPSTAAQQEFMDALIRWPCLALVITVSISIVGGVVDAFVMPRWRR